MPKQLPSDTWTNLFYPPSNYDYFANCRHFDFEPAAVGFSWKNAWWLAEASLLAYVKDRYWDSIVKPILEKAGFDRDHIVPIGVNPITDEKSTRGFFAGRSGASPFAVVAFRGTDRDDRRTAETDLKTLPVRQPEGYVLHEGFALAFDSIWTCELLPQINQFLNSHPGATVYFTGHSLGAALATIASARFPGTNSALYTFGSPRVGDEEFVKTVQAKTSRIFRFINSQDIVTLIPLEVLNTTYFRHVGLEKYIDHQGRIIDQPSTLAQWEDLCKGLSCHAHSIVSGVAGVFANLHATQMLAQLDPETLRKKMLGLGLEPLLDPPPYVIGNHTPARYAIHIWNFYSGQ